MAVSLDLVGIVTRNMRASLEFYRRPDRADLPDHTEPAGGCRISLAFFCHTPFAVVEDPDGNHVDLFAPL